VVGFAKSAAVSTTTVADKGPLSMRRPCIFLITSLFTVFCTPAIDRRYAVNACSNLLESARLTRTRFSDAAKK
jgi:hypothetical protein